MQSAAKVWTRPSLGSAASESKLERGRVRGVDLYGRSPLDSGPEAVGIGSFHSIPCVAGWARGEGRAPALSEEAKELKSRFCAETPERSPEKQNQSAELEQEAEGGRRNWRGGTGGGRKHSREPRWPADRTKWVEPGAPLNGLGDKGAENLVPASEAERMQTGPKMWFPEMESLKRVLRLSSVQSQWFAHPARSYRSNPSLRPHARTATPISTPSWFKILRTARLESTSKKIERIDEIKNYIYTLP